MTTQEYIERWKVVKSGVEVEKEFQESLPMRIDIEFECAGDWERKTKEEIREELLEEWKDNKHLEIILQLQGLENEIRRNFHSSKIRDYVQLEKVTGIKLLDLDVDVAEGDSTFDLLTSSPQGRAYTALSFDWNDPSAKMMRRGMGNAALDQ
jgi:hypothetical protein